MKKTYRIALGGVVAALGVVCMMLTGVFPFADYALPAMAGLLLVVLVVEVGARWALAVYAVTALLAFFVSNPESAVLYALFFGYYGILKAKLETLKSRPLEWALKFAVFNIAVLLAFFAAVYLLGVDKLLAEFGDFGWYGVLLLWALSNPVFFLYDVALTRVISFYLLHFRTRYLRRLK